MGNDMGAPRILGMRVDPTSYEEATEKVLLWAAAGESRYVCVANVHMVMEAQDDPSFRALVNAADLVTPDGMPLVWMLRKLGHPHQERVRGPELTSRVCAEAARRGVPVGFYGGHPEALEALVRNLSARFPGLRVVYAYSPPFRPLTPEEDERVTEEINASGARILFVGLGCPKQEWWSGQ
jgi:N-acetylglucosaminyldiphosphoundecaprenol N-acetyl-beta-D-mannosaminyltransferase